MSKSIEYADLSEQVFENRNKEYGAYRLRKSYWLVLLIAAGLAYVIYLGIFGVPMILNSIFPEEVVTLNENRFISDISMVEAPPDLDNVEEPLPPPPPPEIKIKPPAVKAIEFKVPVPTDQDDVPLDVTINEMDSIETSTPGLTTTDGEDVPYDFDAEEGDGIVKVIEEKDPEIGEFIFVEKEPEAVNLDDIIQMIGYPPSAREAGIEGKVHVRILVGKNGKYERHVLTRKAHPLLNRAVEEKISRLSFTPGIQSGKPIKVWVTVPFDFTLSTN